MKNRVNKLQGFEKKIAKSQLLSTLATKNLKGGLSCPPPIEDGK